MENEDYHKEVNLETFEIEKHQELNDWDLITIKLPRGRSLIGVFKSENDKRYYLHANLDSRGIITIYEVCFFSVCKLAYKDDLLAKEDKDEK